MADALSRHQTYTLSYTQRAELANTPALAAYLLRLMAVKKTNLCLSADVTTTHDLLDLAEQVGDYICMLKTHIDIVTDFTKESILALREIAARKGFVVFEDRKLGDIGSTVQKQYAEGAFGIASWAEIVNAHIFPGPAIVTALADASKSATLFVYEPRAGTDEVASAFASHLGKSPGHGLLLLAQMSSEGCLMTAEYTRRCVEIARQNRDFVIGFIAQESLNTDDDDNFISMAPGVKILEKGESAGDGLGQQYNSPEAMIVEKGVDVVIVGRGILKAANRAEMAERYRQAAWEAYEKRVELI